MTTTCIRQAAWVVAWDSGTQSHYYRRDIDVVFEDDRISHLDAHYRGPVDEEIDGRERCVLPGMVNVHTHLVSENLGRGLIEELGNPNLYMSGIFDAKAPYITGKLHPSVGGLEMQLRANRAATRSAIAELLMSGATTVVDLAVAYEGWLDTLAETGIRAYAGPMFREASWQVPTGTEVRYDWDRGHGEAAFQQALRVVDAARDHACGRLDGMIAPAQVDTCSADLLTRALDAARRRDLKMTMHCAQGVSEFHEMVRRHGLTPVQWLHENGLLGTDTLLGHAVFLDHNSWVQWHTRRDIDLLAETGTSVAHCPTVFSRYGQVMEDVGGYLRRGINVALGTDTEPHNMSEEVRTATILGKVAARHIHGTRLADIFHAATVGGAKALGRDDLGRVTPGAKADLVLLDLREPSMRPLRDPLRSFLFVAADRAVRDVYVDGRRVVHDHRPQHIDRQAVAGELQIAQEAFIKNTPYVDFQGRNADQLSPLSFPLET